MSVVEDECFIEAVREFPCLWRVSSRAYKDLRAKENAWKEVSKLVDGLEIEYQRRWKQLRDKYVREKKKTKGKSGDPGPVTTSCWPLYDILDFLRETVRHKSTVTNFQRSSTSSISTSRVSSSAHTLIETATGGDTSETEVETSINEFAGDSTQTETPQPTMPCDGREHQRVSERSGASFSRPLKRKKTTTPTILIQLFCPKCRS